MAVKVTDTRKITIKLKAPPYPSWIDVAPIVTGLLLIALGRM